MGAMFAHGGSRLLASASEGRPRRPNGAIAGAGSVWSVRNLPKWVKDDLESQIIDSQWAFRRIEDTWREYNFTEESWDVRERRMGRLEHVPEMNCSTGVHYIHGQQHIYISKAGQAGFREFRKHQILFKSGTGFPILLGNSTTVIADRTSITAEDELIEWK